MFKNLDKFIRNGSTLEYDKDGKPSGLHLQVAAAGLLVEVASADREFSGQELSRICTCMFEMLGLNEEEAAHLLEVATFLLNSDGKRDEFLSIINNNCSVVQKESIVEMMWRVIEADRKVKKEEGQMAAMIGAKLGLSVEQALKCRARAGLHPAPDRLGSGGEENPEE